MLTTKGLCAAHPVAELTSSHPLAGVSQTGIWSPLLSFSYCLFYLFPKGDYFQSIYKPVSQRPPLAGPGDKSFPNEPRWKC